MERRGQPSTHVISITPFHEDGEVDYDGARAHLTRLRDAGVGVYVAGGGSGEGHTLSDDEVAKLLALGSEVLKGKVPVRAMGVEPRTPKQMIALVRVAAETGMDATQIYSLDMGHLGQPAADELDRYYNDVLNACEIPAVISTHFSVGYMIPIDLLCRLCERYDSIIGINCSTNDTYYLTRLLAELPGHVEVHVGGPMHAMTNWAMGGTGFLSSEGNLAPKLTQSLVDNYAAGNYAAAEEDYTKVNRLFMASRSGGDMKSMFRALGLPGGYPRLPRVTRWDEEGIKAAKERLRALRIPELEPLLASPTP